jgi:hypothetical protein
VIRVSVRLLLVWFGLFGFNSLKPYAKSVFYECWISDLSGGFNEPPWYGMARIDDGTVVMWSSACTFESAVVFVMFGDGAHKSVCLRTPFFRDVYVLVW